MSNGLLGPTPVIDHNPGKLRPKPLSWFLSPSAEDRLTVSQRSVEEGFRLQRHRNESDQARGRNPARVTVTSRRTAALDGRLLAAVRAWRQ